MWTIYEFVLVLFYAQNDSHDIRIHTCMHAPKHAHSTNTPIHTRTHPYNPIRHIANHTHTLHIQAVFCAVAAAIWMPCPTTVKLWLCGTSNSAATPRKSIGFGRQMQVHIEPNFFVSFFIASIVGYHFFHWTRERDVCIFLLPPVFVCTISLQKNREGSE